MSISALNWAFEQGVTPAGRKFVLVALANYASEDGYCYPSQATLQAMTGQGERAVRDHLAALEALGLIRRERRGDDGGHRSTDGYTLLAPPERLSGRVLPAKSAGRKTGAKGARLPAKSAGRDAGRLPADVAGREGVAYRQISPRLPADPAGTYKDEPKDEPKDITPLPPFAPGRGGAAGDADAVTFDQVWAALPHAPNDPRRRAAKAFDAFKRAGCDGRALLDAAHRYAGALAGNRDWRQIPMYAARFIRSGWLDYQRPTATDVARQRALADGPLVAREAPSGAAARWRAGWAVLAQQLGDGLFTAWIADLELVGGDGAGLVLAASSAFRRDYIDTHFAAALVQALGPVRLVISNGAEGSCS